MPSPARPLRLVLSDAPRTKKTHNRIISIGAKCRACGRGTPRVMPSEQWTAWSDRIVPLLRAALFQLLRGSALSRVGTGPLVYVEASGDFAGAIARPVNCAAIFYRDRAAGDSHGFYQGLADVLQEADVVADDKWIVSWDGSRLDKDAAQPRVELVLS